ncbi:MAG: trigger factor [Bacteriovoracia bacterium]
MLNFECNVENKSSIRKQLNIKIQPDSIKAYIEKQYASLQKTVKLKGFRQGKVPLNIIKQYYGADVKNDVFSKIVRDSYIRALEDNKLYAVGLPQIETKSGSDLADGAALEFSATIEIFPEIKLGDMSKINVKRESEKLTDKEFDEQLERIRQSRAQVLPDESNSGPVKVGSIVTVSFSGEVDEKPLENLKSENRVVEVGNKQFMQEFEDALIGMKTGDSKTFDLPFAKEFGDKTLAGKTAKMTVQVHEFKKREVPELNDEFAKQLQFETLDALKTKVRTDLQEQKKENVYSKLKEDLLKELIAKNPFEVPNALIDSQYEYLVKENSYMLQREGVDLNNLPKELQERFKSLAEDQVRASLILNQIGSEQEIKVEPADFEFEYKKMAEKMNLPIEQVQSFYDGDEEGKKQLRHRIKETRTIDWLLSKVKVDSAD